MWTLIVWGLVFAMLDAQNKIGVGDIVVIKNYTGMLHPLTEYEVLEIRPDLAKLRVRGRGTGGVLGFTNESWHEVTRLSIVHKCRCTNVGQDDGQTTCWLHHDCLDGSCTHHE